MLHDSCMMDIFVFLFDVHGSPHHWLRRMCSPHENTHFEGKTAHTHTHTYLVECIVKCNAFSCYTHFRLFHQIQDKGTLVHNACAHSLFHTDTHNKTLQSVYLFSIFGEHKCISVEHVLRWDFSVDAMNIWRLNGNVFASPIVWLIVAVVVIITMIAQWYIYIYICHFAFKCQST